MLNFGPHISWTLHVYQSIYIAGSRENYLFSIAAFLQIWTPRIQTLYILEPSFVYAYHNDNSYYLKLQFYFFILKKKII